MHIQSLIKNSFPLANLKVISFDYPAACKWAFLHFQALRMETEPSECVGWPRQSPCSPQMQLFTLCFSWHPNITCLQELLGFSDQSHTRSRMISVFLNNHWVPNLCWPLTRFEEIRDEQKGIFFSLEVLTAWREAWVWFWVVSWVSRSLGLSGQNRQAATEGQGDRQQ